MDTFRVVLVLLNFGLSLAVNNLVATPLIQSFFSHPGFGSTNYPAGNYTQDWHITTNWVNHTIKLNIKSCVLESPKGVCTYDFLYIYDGADSNSTQMMKSCCGAVPPHPGNSWESTLGEIYLLFVTDDLVTDQGFEIEYWSNGITTTTSTTPAPTTESTTAMQTNSESTQANPTQTVSAKAETADNTLYIIIACSVTGLLVLVVVILIIVVCIKKNKPVTPQPFLVQNEKSMQMKNGKNNPVLSGPPPTPPIGTMMTNAETNLFDLELPEKARGNLLPPLYSSKVVNNPSG